MIITSWVLAGVALTIILLMLPFLRWRTGQINTMMRMREDFFQAADNLISDDDTPEFILDYLEWLSSKLDSPQLGHLILLHALNGELRATAESPMQDEAQLSKIIDDLRPELQEQVAKATAAGLLAVTFTNWLLGPFIRRMILFSITKNAEQAEIVANSVYHHNSINDGMGAVA